MILLLSLRFQGPGSAVQFVRLCQCLPLSGGDANESDQEVFRLVRKGGVSGTFFQDLIFIITRVQKRVYSPSYESFHNVILLSLTIIHSEQHKHTTNSNKRTRKQTNFDKRRQRTRSNTLLNKQTNKQNHQQVT